MTSLYFRAVDSKLDGILESSELFYKILMHKAPSRTDELRVSRSGILASAYF